jgi:DNA-binding transcriptional MocR family regulator
MKKSEAVYERYRTLVSSGELAGGERLPSIREAAEAAGVSVNTVVAAFGRLADEGWVRSRERGGFYVRPRTKLAESSPAPEERFLARSREAGERLDALFERLVRRDPSFAVAAPGTDLLPADRLERSFRRMDRRWIEYADPAGDRGLRRKIVETSEAADGPGDPESIVVTNGATEALAIALRAMISPGDTVAVEAPTYFNFFRQLAPLGVDILEIPVGEDGMDLDILERELAARRVRAMLVQPNVQNPTGATMSDGSKERMVRIAERHGTVLIQDDVYGDLHFGPGRPANLESFGGDGDVVLVSSYSKSVAPGLRIGWLRSRRHAERFAEEKLRLSTESCRAAQFALAEFLGTSAHRRHLAELRAALSRRIDDHLALLSDLLPAGCSVRRPTGGCLLWIALPPGTDATAVFERAAGRGVVAAPGELFSANPFFRSCLRINAGRRLTPERSSALAALADSIR